MCVLRLRTYRACSESELRTEGGSLIQDQRRCTRKRAPCRVFQGRAECVGCRLHVALMVGVAMAGTLQWRTNRRNQSAPCGQSSTHGCSVSRPRHRGRAPHHVAVWLGMLCILASCVQGSSMPTRGQFSLLGVGASASSTEVRKAYRRRARILCVLRGLSRATLGCAWRLAAAATHTCAVAVIRIRTLTIPMPATSFLSLPTRTRQFLSMPRPGTATAALFMLHVGCVPPNHVAVACREEGRLHNTQPRYRQQQQRYGRQQYSQRYHQQHNQRQGQDHDQRYSHRT